MHEILTLQLGNFSNHVATHFWNAQESYFTYSDAEESVIDHHIHWREGIAADGTDTFLPRTVIYDLKGGFGTLRKINALYDDGDTGYTDPTWSGRTAVHRQTPLELSNYQASLEDGTSAPAMTTTSTRYWSDFSRVYYHPKSSVQIYDYELNSSIMPFERFHMGNELFDTLDKEHDIVDRDLRPFAEECDMMQGIQVLTTLDDAWGGFGASYIEALRDEYPKTTIWTWGLQTSNHDANKKTRLLRLVNTAQSLSGLCDQSSILIPLSLPGYNLSQTVSIDRSSKWHTSALLSAALETASLPSRLRNEQGGLSATLDTLTSELNTTGNRGLADLDMSTESHSPPIQLSLQGLNRELGKDYIKDAYARTTVDRGACWSSPEREKDNKTESHVYSSSLSFPLLDSYPRIYANTTNSDNMAVRTNLTTSAAIASRLKQLRTETARLIEVAERELLMESLSRLGEAYQEDWSSGSDIDDDT